jgi:hypothetical protein
MDGAFRIYDFIPSRRIQKALIADRPGVHYMNLIGFNIV